MIILQTLLAWIIFAAVAVNVISTAVRRALGKEESDPDFYSRFWNRLWQTALMIIYGFGLYIWWMLIN